MKQALQTHIENCLNTTFSNKLTYSWQAIGGGSINSTYKISSKEHSFFVKKNTNSTFDTGFKKEVLGLDFLGAHTILTPKVIYEGVYLNDIFLVLEWVESGNKTASFWQNFAEQLAHLHQQSNSQFGLDHSNFMGSLIQNNTQFNNFSDFFIENRLKPQVKLAFDNNKLEKKHVQHFEKLYLEMPAIFPIEKPSAIHGDLWSGNYICSNDEKAVFIDPAEYYGHREIDIAMTQLFGGFPEEFYKNYQEIIPLEPCFTIRSNFYNLYPLLIHLNLFGDSYLGSIDDIITIF